MYNLDARPLSLTLLWEEGRVCASLSDSRSVGLLGSIAVSTTLLDEVAAQATQLLRQPSTPSFEDTDCSSLEDRIDRLGGLIFSRLLPPAIARFLADSMERPLFLQLSTRLLPIPWEIAFDGSQFLGHKFAISRYLLSDQPVMAMPSIRAGADAIKVLVVHSDDELHFGNLYAQGLLSKLAGAEGLSVKGVATHELAHAQLLRLVGESDIVHCIGPLAATVHHAEDDGKVNRAVGSERNALSVREIAHLTAPPALLIFERTDIASVQRRALDNHAVLASDISRAGLSALFRNTLLAGDDQPGYMAEFYKALARGACLGIALRDAALITQGSAKLSATACLDTTLYGDATVALAQQQPQQEDNNQRQVTVFSYDLVDSTKLLRTLGAEKYSDVLDNYHACCAQIVQKWGGVANDPQGSDGVMCYFGLHVAYENSAAQCLRAALETVEAVAKLQLRIRIGIVTGPVAVKAGMPVGVAIHFAARLQSIAEPGTVVVSESTRQIVQQQFDFAHLAHVPELKGIDRPGAAHRLLGERHAYSHPPESAPRPTPFVGRSRELVWLQDHWAQICHGTATAVLVSGEAGIGKSRLVREFRHTLANSEHTALECRCTADHANSAFHPVTDLLRRWLKIQQSDTPLQKRAKLEAGLRLALAPNGQGRGATWSAPDEALAALHAMAALLAIPLVSGATEQKVSVEKQRQVTLKVLVRWIAQQAHNAPVCLVVEDVQWADPSSRELFKQLVATSTGLPLLVLLTQRTEASAPRDPGFAVKEIELKGLTPEATQGMIRSVYGESPVNHEAVRLLADKSDGVPLFIEESARMLLDLKAANASTAPGKDAGADSTSDTASALNLSVPGTIQDLLMARLDRLAGAKHIAQLGSAMGREFSLGLMQAVLAHDSSPVRADNLVARLHALVLSGMLMEKTDGDSVSYFFKHALMRDAAYQSLWERDRRKFHRAIALTVSDCFPELVQSQPEMLAHHYTGAGIHAKAVEHWQRAARLALSRSAHEEAISHLGQGLALVDMLPVGPERDRAELSLQLLLAGQLIATEGYGAERVGAIYQRASALCRASGDQRALLKVQFGLEGYHFMRGNFGQAHAIAAQATDLVRQSSDPMRRVQSTWAVANILFHQGDLVSAVAHMDAGLADYHKLEHRPSAVQDPGVMCLCYSALAQWERGLSEDALRRANAAIALAEQLKHKFSLGEAYGLVAMLHYFRSDYPQALRCAQHAKDICEEGGFTVWLAHAKLIHGRALAQLGDAKAGIAEMADGYSMWVATGAVVTRAFYLAIQAEGYALAGQPHEGLGLLQTAFDLVSRYGERYYEAEIRRLYGELLLQSAALQGQDRQAEAERWFSSALDAANSRQLDAHALRAATSLAQLCSRQGRVAEAQRILTTALANFKENLPTHDRLSARHLLDLLEAGNTSV